MGSNFSLIWWVLGLPLIGFLIQSLLGKRIVGNGGGKRLAGALAVLPIAAAFGIAVMITLQLANLAPEQRSVVVHGFEWITLSSIRIPFEFLVDPLSMTMVLIITGIGSLIHLYATGYMADEKDYTRFFTYLNLFIASMLILVLGNNLVALFVGWEGVGLCSYLLIGFWYKDVANAKAANKAFIVNRIGDWGLSLGIFLLTVVVALNADKLGITDGRYLSYDAFLPKLGEVLQGMPAITTAIALLLFVGACGKSAQFPLYLWLPDAMAGPTPVSALIHAATMVTSGIVLLNRMHIVFEMSPVASAIVCVIGAFTALFAALVAFGQTDIKKVLAYSTVSQLGFMFIGCGAGGYWTGMFHVTTHAFFKALLFLGSGAVIYAMAHNQDMRNYGNLRKYLPITTWTMVIGFVAIAGLAIPLGADSGFGFAGFFSKESILGAALANDHANAAGIAFSQIAGWTGLFVAALTAMYMTRMTWLTFFGNEERWRLIPAHAHDGHHHGGHDDAHALSGTQEAHALAEEGNAVAVVGTGHEAHGDAHESHDHGPDKHGFFYTHEEMHAREHGEHHDDHHHDLDETHQPKEVPISMWLPLVILAIPSAIGGWLLYNNHAFEHWLYPNGLPLLGTVETHPHGLPLLWLSIGAAFAGTIAGLLVYRKGLPKREGWDEAKWNPFRRWAGNQFGYDAAAVEASVGGGRDLGVAMWKGADAGLIDGIVNGSAYVMGALARVFRMAQTGFIRMYALVMLVGGIGIIALLAYGAYTADWDKVREENAPPMASPQSPQG